MPCPLLRPIPTCVGQPLDVPHLEDTGKAYPHVCGATVCDERRTCISHGLSPRVWGNRSWAKISTQTARPIPTCVGQPTTRRLPLDLASAYPHVCGATSGSATFCSSARGLSPRVWGNQRSGVVGELNIGPIPTCVGQPTHNACVSLQVQAYPHVCGATGRVPLDVRSRWGLSPRVWGNR